MSKKSAKRKPAKKTSKAKTKKSAKKTTPVKAKKKSAKKATPTKAKMKIASEAKTVAKKRTVKKVVKKAVKKVSAPNKKVVVKKPIAKKPTPKLKREPRPQLAMNFEAPETVKVKTDLPEDGPFMDGLGENLMNEAIEDTEDNMERDEEIQKEADNLLSDTDGQ